MISRQLALTSVTISSYNEEAPEPSKKAEAVFSATPGTASGTQRQNMEVLKGDEVA